MTTSPKRRHRSLVVQCLLYVGFGMPIGMLGAGWPEARSAFGRSSGALGIVALGYGLGRLVTSPTALPILRRWPIRSANAALAAALAAACAVVAVTRSFEVLAVAFVAIGLLSGTIDSIGNRYQTVVRDVGSAGLMFGSFGVGSTLGPAIVALAGWTTGYLVAAAIVTVAAVLAASSQVSWPIELAQATPTRREQSTGHVATGVLVISLAAFAIYVGIEVVTANWAASYLTDARNLSGRAAAWAMSGFWAGMTLGRLGLGRLTRARRASPARLMATAGTTVLVVYAAVPLLPPVGAAAALVVGGAALAGIFPTLMSSTADRVGVAATGRVVGWQLLTANISATGLSAAVGLGVGLAGDAVPGIVLAALAIVGLPVLLRTQHVHAETDASTAPGPG